MADGAYGSLDATGKVRVNAEIINAFRSLTPDGLRALRSEIALEGGNFDKVLGRMRDTLAGRMDSLPYVPLNGVDDRQDLGNQRAALRKIRDEVLPTAKDDATYVGGYANSLHTQFGLPETQTPSSATMQGLIDESRPPRSIDDLLKGGTQRQGALPGSLGHAHAANKFHNGGVDGTGRG